MNPEHLLAQAEKLIERSVEHRQLRSLCEVASAATVQRRYQPFVPAAGFSNDIRRFAGLVLRVAAPEAERRTLVMLLLFPPR